MTLKQKPLPCVGGPFDGKHGMCTALSLGDCTIWSCIPIQGDTETSVYAPDPKDNPVRLVYVGHMQKRA